MKDLSKSIVRLAIVEKSYDTDSPWQVEFKNNLFGTGFVIADHIVVTCAHVAFDKHSVTGSLSNSDEVFEFKVLFAVPTWDIAFITTENSHFWSQAQPLKLGAMPRQQEKIQVVGFPHGSENLRRTEGIISSFQYEALTYSLKQGLLMQIDASVNGGNSGGPIILADDTEISVVGMACQHRVGVQNEQPQSFALAVNQIEKALYKYKHNKSDVVPGLALDEQRLQHAATRKYLGLPENIKGVRVTEISKYASYYPQLQVGDVIVAIDGIALSNTGKIATEFCDVLDYEYLVSMKDVGECATVTIWRNNKLLEETITLQEDSYSASTPAPRLPNEQPTFYIYNGIVFCTFAFIQGDQIHTTALLNYYQKFRSAEMLDMVYIKTILTCTVLNGLKIEDNELHVDTVNGHKIRHMWDLIDAFAEQVADYSIIATDGTLIVLPAMSVEDETSLKEQYGLVDFCSKDLRSKDRGMYFSRFPQKLRAIFDAEVVPAAAAVSVLEDRSDATSEPSDLGRQVFSPS
jgi:S1-C subfamily serine protease